MYFQYSSSDDFQKVNELRPSHPRLGRRDCLRLEVRQGIMLRGVRERSAFVLRVGLVGIFRVRRRGRLHTKQPNLSKHLKLLEDALRGRLFTRYLKGLQRIERGKRKGSGEKEGLRLLFLNFLAPCECRFGKPGAASPDLPPACLDRSGAAEGGGFDLETESLVERRKSGRDRIGRIYAPNLGFFRTCVGRLA
jgi:hypothetical protein